MKRQNRDWINKAAAKADAHYRKCQLKHDAPSDNYNNRETRRSFDRFMKKRTIL